VRRHAVRNRGVHKEGREKENLPQHGQEKGSQGWPHTADDCDRNDQHECGKLEPAPEKGRM
jgi:hypothetical protein